MRKISILTALKGLLFWFYPFSVSIMCEATSKAIQAEAEGIVNENYKVKFYILTNKTIKTS